MKLKTHTRNSVDFGKDFQIICYKNGSKSFNRIYNSNIPFGRRNSLVIFSWTNSKWQRKILQLVTVSSNTCHNYCLRHIHCNSISSHFQHNKHFDQNCEWSNFSSKSNIHLFKSIYLMSPPKKYLLHHRLVWFCNHWLLSPLNICSLHGSLWFSRYPDAERVVSRTVLLLKIH